MRAGEWQVTAALLRVPKLHARALIKLLPRLIAEQQKDAAYRIYVTDALRIVGENTAQYVGGNYIKARYVDIIEPKKQDNRTCEEITADIVARCGLTIKKAAPDGAAEG